MSRSSDYFTEFDRVFTLRPRPSRWLLIWWYGLHAVAASGCLLMPVAGIFSALLVTAVVFHGFWRLPGRPPQGISYANGVWSLPGHEDALACARRTRSGTWWVVLVLIERDRPTRFLLLRDQLDSREWYLLKAVLRG